MTISQNGGMFTPHKRRGPIAAEFTGPGPAAIALPTLFGNQAVETKSSAPAFSFGSKQRVKVESVAPAPNVYNVAGLTSRGKDEGPKISMHIKPKEPKKFNTPAPTAYKPEKSEKFLEKKSEIAFGLKHSPYVGSLKGDAWVSPRTEMTNGSRRVDGAGTGTTTYTRTVTRGDGQTSTTTNTANYGGTRINQQPEEFRPRSNTFTKSTGYVSQAVA